MHALHLPQDIAGELEKFCAKAGCIIIFMLMKKCISLPLGSNFRLRSAYWRGALAAPHGLGTLAVTQFGVFDEPEPIQALQQQITAQFGDAVHTVITNGRFLEICHPLAQKAMVCSNWPNIWALPGKMW